PDSFLDPATPAPALAAPCGRKEEQDDTSTLARQPGGTAPASNDRGFLGPVPARRDAPAPRAWHRPAMIELHGITQAYGSHEALRGIDLKIAPGEVFGVIGRSGAGKSSLVRTINLLNRPKTGSVVVGGQELTRLPEAQLRAARREIGLIFQHFNLL